MSDHEAARPRWDLIAGERRAFADLAETLSEQQWRTRSLCGRWTVRDVVAHVMVGPTTSLGGFLRTMVRARGSFDRANDLLARRRAELPLETLVTDLREKADHRFTPPGFDWHAPLADLLVHHADVAVPLGLPLDRPVAAWAESLPFLASRKAQGSFAPGPLLDVRFVATDLDWAHGAGPEVTGPAAALGVVMCGRTAVLTELSGPGVDVVGRWLG